MIGIIAAGITTIISYLIVTILVLHFSFKNFPMNVDYSLIGKIIISSTLMGVILYFLQKYVWSNFLLLMAVGILSYFILLYSVKGITIKEIKSLIGFYK